MMCVYEWLARFREAGKVFLTNPRSGRLVTYVSNESIEKVRKLIPKDPQSTVHMIADELQINPESIPQNITQNLRIIKTCCRY
ncbi:hypothetical protein TNCV_3841931 [Trichonephila clavipes]|nr:hypothetical protein TNCV_3841931 [Trichonephila clavipes]